MIVLRWWCPHCLRPVAMADLPAHKCEPSHVREAGEAA